MDLGKVYAEARFHSTIQRGPKPNLFGYTWMKPRQVY